MITSVRSAPHSVNTSDLAALVKQAVDIVDVIGQVVPLRRSGNRHVGLCPFHREKTPSFHVDSSSQLYHCFGCGIGGDVLSFVMKYQNLPFIDAVRHLADRYHIALPEAHASRGYYPGASEAVRKEKEELYDVLRMSGDFFYSQLHHEKSGQISREYLARRGLPAQVVEAERLGCAPAEWDSLCRHMKKSGVALELGIKAGLVARSAKDSTRFYDRFRNRLIFPIRDDRGRIVGFGGRILSSDAKGEPKYLNSPETLVYQKGRMLYQMSRAREACREVRQVFLVEGYMDLLAFHAQGFYRVAATLGTALTVQQIRILAHMADEVVLAYDADDAGEKAMIRSLPLFLQESVPVSSILFPEGMDPDDFLRKRGLEAFKALVGKRQDLGMLAVRKALESWDGSTAGKSAVIAEMQSLFEAVRQPLLRSEYLRLISDRLGLSEKTVERQLGYGRKHLPKGPAGRRVPLVVAVDETPSLEERIVRLMIKYPELVEEVKTADALECFREYRLKKLAEVLVARSSEASASIGPIPVYDQLPDEETKGIYARFLLDSGEVREARIHMRDWLQALVGRERKLECSDLREALRQAEQLGDRDQVKCLLARLQDLGIRRKRVGIPSENN